MTRFAVLALSVAISLAGTQLVLASAPPYDFTVTPQVPLPGQAVTFTATGLKPSDTVTWDFNGDGIFDATGATVQHTYTTPGQRTVRMRVRQADGSLKDELKTIRVDAPPTASFTAAPNPANVQEVVRFNAAGSTDTDGTITKYEWDLDGNGSFETATGTVATTTRSYAAAGTVNVRLRVTDNNGATAETTVAVVVNQRPVARFTATPNPVLAGQSVTFDGGGSTDADGTIVGYAWDLDNDGQFDDATGATTTRSFAAPGSYTVRLSVTDNRGATDTATVALSVTAAPAPPQPPPNQPPVATFTASPNPAIAGQSVTLNAGGSTDADGTVAGYAWDLDNDGQFDDATGATITRSFAAPGAYTVRLSVTDNRGATDTAMLTVTVNPAPAPPPPNQAPVAAFSAAPNPAATGQTVQFSASASGDLDGTIATYEWDLDGDGQFDDATGVLASRSFGAAGTYAVGLRVTDNRGGADTEALTVTVNDPSRPLPANQPPVASFTTYPRQPLVSDLVEFVSTSIDSDGSIAAQAWDLDGDGQFDDGSAVAVTRAFAAAGLYTVRLRVTDSGGATNVVSRTILVNARPLLASQPQLMSPFPVVRLVATLTRKGARVKLLLVRGAPRGATVTVRCRGRRCPVRRRARTVTSGRLRFRAFERHLRAGASLRIFVRQPGRIGKYTSFKFRRARAPLRRDLCLASTSAKPAACPSS